MYSINNHIGFSEVFYLYKKASDKTLYFQLEVNGSSLKMIP